MRWFLIVLFMSGLTSAQTLWADGEQAGAFDYYVMSLSWSPTYCALEGDARGSDQCDDTHEYGWTLHGLWPQNNRGWPSYCRTSERDPSRRQTAAMADIMGSAGLAWHQWKKHGRCAGLPASDYFATARKAYEQTARPQAFRRLERQINIRAKVVEEAFLSINSDLSADMVTVTCKDRFIHEVRVCLTKDLEPRICGADVMRDCGGSALLDPVR